MNFPKGPRNRRACLCEWFHEKKTVIRLCGSDV